ncbi:S-adenosyl-L-methionine-dependent methyltransferase [Cantharellus anzutake]|uniref:S-adenosyl-L-methionine-dependent methyltransferase n=1 Tax=Cantharellus anzutake TaxID=1750568 RepID=UPI001903E225|nr:S-adenosyl-L-methionine-dependent methyltransferase [Cantharellus anzutake]KAF8323529.1 S-adenosyl-L-methionine-dependent methyltransferase [Cantharellus anzutake]
MRFAPRLPLIYHGPSLSVRSFSHYGELLSVNPRPSGFSNNALPDTKGLRRLTAQDLATHTTPPKNVNVLVRDFIHDALYNPNYGYFSHQATILSSTEPYEFNRIRSSKKFDDLVAGACDVGNEGAVPGSGVLGRQLWHTPVELFQPWYGRAIAQCLTSEYLLNHFPYEDFIIFELGGGNGTLAGNVLDFLQLEYPDVYERTRYHIIEISPRLASLQRLKLKHHTSCLEIANKSIFEWDEIVPLPCYFVALEVIDNFAHDMIRYHLSTLEPYQALIVTTEDGDYEEVYEPLSDPLLQKYLTLRTKAGHVSPLQSSRFLQRLRATLPFAPNLSRPEFVPTHLLSFLEILRDKFPLHRLLLSDFSSLPDTIDNGAINAPVVQTRVGNAMVPCSTYMVQPGYFDIFFPTNFDELQNMYELTMALPRKSMPEEGISVTTPRLDSNFFSRNWRASPVDVSSYTGRRVFSHRDFLYKYGNVEATTLRNGENPMLDYYKNVKFLF